MTDREFKKLRKKVLRRFGVWLPRFGLENWRFQHEFFREAIAGADDAVMATTTASGRYMYGDFRWNLGSLADCTDEDLDGVVVHELVHCILAPISGDGDDYLLEMVTTHLSRILQRTAEG